MIPYRTILLTAVILLSGMVRPIFWDAHADVKTPTVSVFGAGATFPYPLYSKWFSYYHTLEPSVEINYQSIGSGGGIRQVLENTVDFGATDSPMTDTQLSKARSPILHIPTALGAVTLTYNLPGLVLPAGKKLRLGREVLSKIYLGTIYYWDDAALVALNPGAKFPHTPIMVIYRSDGSGTTAVFTEYLCKINPEWAQKVGKATSVKWPIGIGGKGNEGVTGFVKHHPGALGYVELLYAEKNKLEIAAVENKGGNFVTPDVRSISEAANQSIKNIPEDLRATITDAEGKDSYPIASFTYLILYQKLPAVKGQTMLHFLGWALSEGQKFSKDLSYTPLPTSILERARKRVSLFELEKNKDGS